MEVNEFENLYHNIEKESLRLIKNGDDVRNAVAKSLYINLKDVEAEDQVEFVNYLNFSHSYSIKIAYEKKLGEMANIDYEIFKQSNEFKNKLEVSINSYKKLEQRIKPKKRHKSENKLSKMLDELSK